MTIFNMDQFRDWGKKANRDPTRRSDLSIHSHLAWDLYNVLLDRDILEQKLKNFTNQTTHPIPYAPFPSTAPPVPVVPPWGKAMVSQPASLEEMVNSHVQVKVVTDKQAEDDSKALSMLDDAVVRIKRRYGEMRAKVTNQAATITKREGKLAEYKLRLQKLEDERNEAVRVMKQQEASFDSFRHQISMLEEANKHLASQSPETTSNTLPPGTWRIQGPLPHDCVKINGKWFKVCN